MSVDNLPSSNFPENQTNEKLTILYGNPNFLFNDQCLSNFIITPKIEMLLHQNREKQYHPCWFINQHVLEDEGLKDFFRMIIEAKCQIMNIRAKTMGEIKVKLYKRIQHVKFSKLKEMKMICQNTMVVEALSWLQAPNLGKIEIKTHVILPSTKPFSKTNFPCLYKMDISIFNSNHSSYLLLQQQAKHPQNRRNYDLTQIHRTKFCTQRHRMQQKQCRMNIFATDLHNISHLSKFQPTSTPNFQLHLHNQKTASFTLNQNKLINCLTRKFNTRVIQIKDNWYNNQKYPQNIYQESEKRGNFELNYRRIYGY